MMKLLKSIRKKRMVSPEYQFTKWLDENWDDDNIFPPPLDAQEAIGYLQKYLLGEDWYCVDPLHITQINTKIVHLILKQYSKKYRREYKKCLNEYKYSVKENQR